MCKGAKYSSIHFPKGNISFDMGKFHKFSSRMNRLANEFIDESNERTKEYKKITTRQSIYVLQAIFPQICHYMRHDDT